MLIIEGPDMIGKTELVKKLFVKLSNCVVDKFGLPESGRMLEECKLRVRRNKIADRCYVSEIVYGYTCRGQPKVSVEHAREIERMVRNAGGLIVVLAAPDDIYNELVIEHHKRGEAFTPDQCRAVNRAYRALQERNEVGPYRVPVDVRWTAWRHEDGGIVYPSMDHDLVNTIVDKYRRAQKA